MALKITTQIGTDKGITSEAYVRISNYQVSKYGSASFQIEIYQSQSGVPSFSGIVTPAGTGLAQNQQIGSYLYVPLTKEIEKTEGENTVTTIEVDLSPAQEGTIFEFGYTKLKEKLAGLFGAEHVIDC